MAAAVAVAAIAWVLRQSIMLPMLSVLLTFRYLYRNTSCMKMPFSPDIA